MNIVEFLADLANSLPNEPITTEKMKTKTNIKNVIETNNNSLLKSLIPNNISFTHERTVTAYSHI
jgi:hypothetical protein